MDSDEAPPPPYSAVDPLVGQPSNSNNNTNNNRNAAALAEANRNLLRLRGGDASHGSTAAASGITAETLELPAHFMSATPYFIERPPPAVGNGQQTLDHRMTIYPRSQSKDFPRRPRCWSSRMEDISQQDWDMFLRHLFPPDLGLASSSAQLPRQIRAEIQRDRKDRPQETDEQRERRIAAVMMEWNQYFFEPRAARIVFVYVTDPRNSPLSPLCPRCYPAATRASQENRAAQTPEASQPSTDPTGTGPPTPSAYPPPAQPPYGFPNPAINQAPYSVYGAPAFYQPGHHPQGYQYPSPYAHWPAWGWNSYQYPPQHESSLSKGGPLGWITSLAAQAQKYGERISEQAQQYGDQISAHAEHYGRQVEEQAMAHGRWIEGQASFSGRKVENSFTGWPPTAAPGQAYCPNNSAYTYATNNNNTGSVSQAATPAPAQRARRDSVGSNSSESSLSSIDSLSTTSELSSSDLATVRAQLLSLNEHHERDLYEAAVELRRQLDALRESRRQARISGRGNWRHGWGHQSQNNYHSHGRSSWGRWESPQDRQRNQAEKKAAKEEMRATRKAFKDVLRRAREEQREQRRMNRNRRRQERRARKGKKGGGRTSETASLEQSLQNLALDDHTETRSTVPSSMISPARSTTMMMTSPISSISTPSIASSESNDTKDRNNERKRF